MIKVVLNNGQTLSHPDWTGYDTDHKGELDMEVEGVHEFAATFSPNVWRYVYNSEFPPIVDNPAPPTPYAPF